MSSTAGHTDEQNSLLPFPFSRIMNASRQREPHIAPHFVFPSNLQMENEVQCLKWKGKGNNGTEFSTLWRRTKRELITAFVLR